MDKLKELTDRLFNEGLSKGREEGEAILSKAKTDAEAIIAEATKKAEEIIAQAKSEATSYREKVESDVKMASLQAIQATKQNIENLIVSKMTDLDVSKALSSESFIKETITAVAKNFNSEQAADLAVVLPESLRAELEPFVKNELSSVLSNGISASFSSKVKGGFRIGPKDGSYYIDLTDETFKSLISEYLRPQAKKLLFG